MRFRHSNSAPPKKLGHKNNKNIANKIYYFTTIIYINYVKDINIEKILLYYVKKINRKRNPNVQ